MFCAELISSVTRRTSADTAASRLQRRRRSDFDSKERYPTLVQIPHSQSVHERREQADGQKQLSAQGPRFCTVGIFFASCRRFTTHLIGSYSNAPSSPLIPPCRYPRPPTDVRPALRFAGLADVGRRGGPRRERGRASAPGRRARGKRARADDDDGGTTGRATSARTRTGPADAVVVAENRTATMPVTVPRVHKRTLKFSTQSRHSIDVCWR